MFSSSDLSNASHIGSVVRRITQLRSQSASTRTPVVIVIDEINRAEPSRVFGELLTLLEINKREGMEEEKKIALPYSKELFSVPQEVSVIGTMNTVDRSLTALDFAMRRRFEFELVSPEPDLVSNNMAGVDVQALLIRLNARIKLLLGSGYEFGHAFFMESRISSVQKSEHWLGLADGELRALAHILRANIFPTLGEYLHDDWVKVRAVAGQAQTPTKLESLFEKKLSDATFLDRLSDDYEIAEVRPGSYASWWDPKSNTWDSDRFKAFIIALAAGL
ncbi:AAA family ATPase [Xanthomonas arboricola]|nr:AAA family ATPase [Xanthomonas arboricola]